MSTQHPHPHLHFVAGSLSIDFANTGGVGGTDGSEQFDDIPTVEGVRRWFAASSLGLDDVVVTAEDLPDLQMLRDALWRMARQQIDHGSWDPADLAIVNRAAATAPLVPLLTGADAPLTWESGPSCAAALSTIAREALDLFSGPLRARLRECANPNCILFFVDSSRPGRRRWCSMDACGNRAKTRDYRARIKGEHDHA